MRHYCRHNRIPKCKQVRKCNKHQEPEEMKVVIGVQLVDPEPQVQPVRPTYKRRPPIGKPPRRQYEYSIFS